MAEIAVVVAALATAGASINTSVQTTEAARAQKNLANQQSQELYQQQESANQQAAAQATDGSSFGFGGDTTSTGAIKGLGFGAAPALSANSGRGQITGMG